MKKLWLQIALCIGFIAGCQKAPQLLTAEGQKFVAFQGQQVVPQQVVFAGKRDVVESYFAERGQTVHIEPVDEEGGIYSAKFEATSSLSQVLTDLSGRLEFVEPNYAITVKAKNHWPRDPEFFNLWGLNNLGQAAPYGLEGRSGADIGTLKAWELTKGSREVVVAVIDTGVDYNHPDLKENIWVNQAEKNGMAGIDDDKNGFVDDIRGWDFVSNWRTDLPQGFPGDNDPMDEFGHGTHCAGTIGALANNNTGVTGVAWNVSIMALRFLDENGSGTSLDAFRAIRYAAKMGAHVMSNSWGGGAPSKLVERAIAEANDKGVVFVAAAGNSSTDNDREPNYPSNYKVDNVIAVGASDNQDAAAEFSSFGKETVHVFAPGVNILSTIPTAQNASYPYAVYSGTSMATPHVAGAVALLLSYRPELRGQPLKVRNTLIETSDQVFTLLGKSVSDGRINTFRMLTDNRNKNMGAAEFKEEYYGFTSPAFPQTMTDVRHKITKPGAKAIRVHFSFFQVDQPYDEIYLYDGNHRLVGSLTDMGVDYWSPTVPGDTVEVRFVNSRVRVIRQQRLKFESPDKGFEAGASMCERGDDGATYCWVDKEPQDFDNFNSEGFSIDRIAYSGLSGEGGGI